MNMRQPIIDIGLINLTFPEGIIIISIELSLRLYKQQHVDMHEN